MLIVKSKTNVWHTTWYRQKVIKKINEKSKIDLIPTFLGAHDFPKEYNNKDEYVDLICNKMIPFISDNQLAEYCDVFCEDGFFTLEQTRKIINCANGYGIKGRLHADELKYSSSAELAELSAKILIKNIISSFFIYTDWFLINSLICGIIICGDLIDG